MKLLLTAIGKRIQLIEHLKTQFTVVGTDASEHNAAKHFVDAFYVVPKFREEGYIDALADICEKEHIDVIIPLYEPEFPVLNANRDQLERTGAKLLLSTQEVIAICDDKVKSATFFEQQNIDAPHTYSEKEIEQLLEDTTLGEYPMIIKPLDGMGSEGVFKVQNPEQLKFFLNYVDCPILQSMAKGTEYTIDALCDLQGNPVYIVPRVRVEVRSGEVVKSRIDMQELIVEKTAELLRKLNEAGHVMGPMTIQCFLSEDGKKAPFIEINPRFGGGVPLSFAAGADYAKVISDMLKGVECPDYREANKQLKQISMMRYDQAVYEEV